MPTALLEQQLMEKIGQLSPLQKQTVYDFVDFLLSKPLPTAMQKSALATISVWDESAIQTIVAAQQEINEWTLPTF